MPSHLWQWLSLLEALGLAWNYEMVTFLGMIFWRESTVSSMHLTLIYSEKYNSFQIFKKTLVADMSLFLSPFSCALIFRADSKALQHE